MIHAETLNESVRLQTIRECGMYYNDTYLWAQGTAEKRWKKKRKSQRQRVTPAPQDELYTWYRVRANSLRRGSLLTLAKNQLLLFTKWTYS